MTDTLDAAPRWAARLDAYRASTDPGFGDTLRIISAYYELYERGARFMSPWISRQNSSKMPFMAPDKEEVKAALGKPRAVIHTVAYNAFVESLIQFAIKNKGRRQLITPNQTSHHSAQFVPGTFEIRKVADDFKLAGASGKARKSVHSVEIYGAESPLYVENLNVPVDNIGHIIVRPKIGKLGTASAVNWEILFFRGPQGYMINHVDSDLNPRWSGIL